MRIPGLKSRAIPKVALIAVALAGGLVLSTVDVRPAQATPSRARDCTGCHGSGTVAGTVTASPSTTTPAPSATYTVAISIATSASGNTGFWIANSTAAGATGTTTGVTGGPSSATTHTATMTAPATAGTYYYKVWGNQGMDDGSAQTNFGLYSITVAAPTPSPAASFTASATTGTAPLALTFTDTSTNTPTTWAWSFGNGTTSTVRNPPVTYLSAGTYTVTLTASNASGASTPVTRTITVTAPGQSIAHISGLSRTQGTVGSRVRITGSGFGTPGVVKFGTVSARVLSWGGTRIVVRVPAGISAHRVLVTVTPGGGTASNGIRFSVVHGDDGDDGEHGNTRIMNSLWHSLRS